MEIVIGVLVGGVLGYALRGSIGRELKTLGADLKRLVAEIKAKI